MKIDLKNLENSRIEINVEITLLDFEKEIQQVVKRKKENITIAGFRKGKAPENIVFQNIGEMNILNKAAENVINYSYKKIIKEKNIKPLGNPEINIIKIARNNPLIFKIIISIAPEINLPDYNGENLPKIKKNSLKKVDEKEIEQTLDYIKKSRAKLFKKEDSSVAEKGDFVYIEYNEVGDDKKNEDRFILGQSATQINPFEKDVLGMKQGESKIVKITAEKKEQEFNLLLKALKRVELPEINDEFIKTIGNFKNLEDFKKNIREGLMAEKAGVEKQRVCFEFLEKIRNKTKIEVPEVLIKSEQNKLLSNFKENIEKEVSYGEYLKKTGKKEEEILRSFEEQAKIRVTNFLILREIAKKQNIKATKNDIELKIKEIIQHYGLKEKDIDKDQIEKYADEQIISQKTFDYIYFLYFNK